MIEDLYLRRVMSLMSGFRSVIASKSEPFSQAELRLLDGEATNVIRLLREVKRSVVQDEAAGKYAPEEVVGVKAVIDRSVREVMAKRSGWRSHHAHAADASTPAPSGASGDLAQQLLVLSDMYTAGLLTDNEFQAAKARIL